jgi:hypothetical protein
MGKVFSFFIFLDFEATFRTSFLCKFTNFLMLNEVLFKEFFSTAKIWALNDGIHAMLYHMLLEIFPFDLFIASLSLVLTIDCQFF